MTEIELIEVDSETPITDGIVITSMDGTDPVVEINPAQKQLWIYNYALDTEPDWIQFHALVMFDASDYINTNVSVNSIRMKPRGIRRHNTDSCRLAAYVYPGDETEAPFDVDKIDEGEWGGLNDRQNIITLDLDYDDLISEFIDMGASQTVDTNEAVFSSEDAPVYEINILQSSRLEKSIQTFGIAGIVFANVTEHPSTLDTANFPNAGFNPSNSSEWDDVKLVIEADSEVEISGTVTFTVSSTLDATIVAEPLFHSARRQRNYNRR